MKVYYNWAQLNPTTETKYTDLANRPSINGVDLLGDLSTEGIKVSWYGTQAEFDALASVDPYTLYIINDGEPVGEQESYLDLADKPSINGQVLTGNKISSDLNMYDREEVDNMLASMRSIKTAATLPATPTANTVYYIGPIDSEGTYDVFLYDSMLTQIYLGPSVQKPYTAGNAVSISTDNKVNVLVDNKTILINSEGKLESAGLAGNNGEDDKTPLWLDDGTVKAFTHTIFDIVYPVGSIFTSITHSTAAQVQDLFGGTWVALSDGYYLMNTTTAGQGGVTVNEQLPNIKGAIAMNYIDANGGTPLGWNGTKDTSRMSGAFYTDTNTSFSGRMWPANTDHSIDNRRYPTFRFDASAHNSVYTNDGHVIPKSIKVYMYQRTA